jgi:hypothetical protein
MIRKKYLDTILPVTDVTKLAEHLQLEQEELDSDSEDDGTSKKSKSKKKKTTKGRSNKSNFSSFRYARSITLVVTNCRNKSYS